MRSRAAVLWVLLGGCADDVGDGIAGSSVTIDAPTGLAGAAQNGGTEIALTWNDNASLETGYRVEVNDGPFGSPPYVEVAVLPANSTSYLHRTLPNTTRRFRVFAVTANYQSPPSNEISIVTPDVPLAPSYLTGLVTSIGRLPPSTNAVDLAWVNAAGTTGNTLEFSSDGGVSWTPVSSFAAGAGIAGAAHAAVPSLAEFRYRVYAINGNGPGAPSLVAAVQAQGFVPKTPLITSIGTDDVGLRASLAVAAGGVHHVSHYSATASDLLYTTGTMTGGHATTMLDGLNFAVGFEGTSLALDGNGRVHIAAHEYWGQVLRYVTNATGVFTASTLDSDGIKNIGRTPKLRVSPADGTIQIVYREDDGSDSNLRRIVRGAGGWGTPATLLPASGPVGPHSFAIDSIGLPHVVFSRPRAGGYEIVHSSLVAGAWSQEAITSQGLPDHNDVAVGPANALHVSYNDASTGALMYATNAGGSWWVEEVHRHTTGNLGRYNSVAVNPVTGRVHVAYYDAVNGNLWHAYRDLGNAWRLELMEWSADVGRYASIALNGNEVHIAYYDVTNGDLRLLTYQP